MITDCIGYLKTVLTQIGIEQIYDKPSDVSAFKGSDYVLLLTTEKETADYDGNKVAYTDDFERAVRTYHIRRYRVALTLTARLVGKEDAAVMARKDAFLAALGRAFADSRNYRIDIEAIAARWIKDTSILASGAGYEVDVKFDGGVYVTREVKLLTGVDTDTGTMKTGGAEHDKR